YRPVLDFRNIKPFPGEFVANGVLVAIDQPALKGLCIDASPLLPLVHALGKTGLDPTNQWCRDGFRIVRQDWFERGIEDDDVLKLKPDCHSFQTRRLRHRSAIQSFL